MDRSILMNADGGLGFLAGRERNRTLRSVVCNTSGA
jgi:hypothetical protein